MNMLPHYLYQNFDGKMDVGNILEGKNMDNNCSNIRIGPNIVDTEH